MPRPRLLLGLAVLCALSLAACEREKTPIERLREADAAQQRHADSVARASLGEPDTTVRMPSAEEIRAYRLEMATVRRWAAAGAATAPHMQGNPALVERVRARAGALAPTPADQSRAFYVAQAAEPLLVAEMRGAGLEPRDWYLTWIKINAASAAQAREMGLSARSGAELATPEDVRFLEENAAEMARVMEASLGTAGRTP